MNSQKIFKEALLTAAVKHHGQKLPGTKLPYIVHIANVALEVMVAGNQTPGFKIEFALTLALLHDTIEDTGTVYLEVKEKFGKKVADGVLALTKFSNLQKAEQIEDCLRRIKQLDTEVWAVKMADRITNLEAPPLKWHKQKRKQYLELSERILVELGEANPYLAKRLDEAIQNYKIYVETGKKA